jgi:hypothetical protein
VLETGEAVHRVAATTDVTPPKTPLDLDFAWVLTAVLVALAI